MTFRIQTDRALIRAAGGSSRYVLVEFTAPESPQASQRESVNVAFVIDRSGSMGGSKIELARAAVKRGLQMLRSTDRFSVVGFDDEVDVFVPSTLATREAVNNAITQVQRLQARGSTDLNGGWLKGCEQLAEHQRDGQTTRCILLTDGQANRGVTDHADIIGHAEALREHGVTTSTIGLGADYEERLLEPMATAGGGHFYFVERAVQIADCLTGELGEALDIVARDVVLQVTTASNVQVTTLNQLPVHTDERGHTVVRLGDLVSRQDVSVVLRLRMPGGLEGQTISTTCGVRDARSVLDPPDSEVTWTFADHASNDNQRRNVAVDRHVARLYAAQAEAEALELNRAGRFDEARVRLEATARRIEHYAGADPDLRAIVRELRDKNRMYSQQMSAIELKKAHFASFNIQSMRDPSGKARRARE